MRRKVVWEPHEIGLLIVAGVLALFVFIGSKAMGAVVNIPYVIPSMGGDYDSARVDTYIDDAGSYTFVDSQSVLSLPKDTTFGLNDTANWVVNITYYSSLIDSFTDPLFYPLSSNAVASITTGDKEDIAQLVKDTADAYPSTFYGPSATGSGLYDVHVYTIDTSGTDDTVSSVVIDINTSSGSNYAGPTRAVSGLDSFNLDAGTYLGLAYKTGYAFPSYSFTISANDTVDIYGYNTVTTISSPSDTGLCRVYGYIKDRGNGVYGATVTLTLPEHAYDSCNSTILLQKTFSDNTDGDGLFSMDVPKSSCLNRDSGGDLMQYSVQIKYSRLGAETKKHKFEIPADSTTYYLVF